MTKKRVKIIVLVCVLATALFMIYAVMVSVNPYDYVTIAFDGARPFLAPKVIVDKNAPDGLKPGDFSMTAEHSRNEGKRLVLADEGQLFTVKCNKKNDFLNGVVIRNRKKTYKVGDTPMYVRDSDDLNDPNDLSLSAEEKLTGMGKDVIKSSYPKYRFQDIKWMGMYSMINKKYDNTSDVQDTAFLVFNVLCKKMGGRRVIIVEMKNLAIDGRYNLHSRKGNSVWNLDDLGEFYYSGILDDSKYDVEMDNAVHMVDR